MSPSPLPGAAVRIRLLAGIALLLLATGVWFFARRSPDALVVYCAHDAVFADGILRKFEKQTGIPVLIRYDTEATKSLGLVELLIREKDAPTCDVFWNNEALGTMDLADRGILAPYRGSGWERIPAAWKEPQGLWTGFAARFRVTLLNTDAIKDARSPAPSLPPGFDRWALAKPLYGTTLTHFSILWKVWGQDRLQQWHDQRRQGGIRILNGNGAVKDAVASGACDAGFTDTDDSFDALDQGAPVTMHPIRLDDGRTICIPNTVGLIRGSQHMEKAKVLIDYLLSAETELALAQSKSRQVPLGAVSEELLPPDVKPMVRWVQDGVPLEGLVEARATCLMWLKAVYAP